MSGDVLAADSLHRHWTCQEDLEKWLTALNLPSYRPPPPSVLLREYSPGEFDVDGDGSMDEEELQVGLATSRFYRQRNA